MKATWGTQPAHLRTYDWFEATPFATYKEAYQHAVTCAQKREGAYEVWRLPVGGEPMRWCHVDFVTPTSKPFDDGDLMHYESIDVI